VRAEGGDRVFCCLGRAIASVAALCVFGCLTPPHPYAIASGREGAPGAKAFLLLPLNLVVALPGELERPSGRVSQLTADYLAACGKDVSSVSLYSARDFWRGAVRDVEQSEDAERTFDTAAPLFVRRIRESQPFDALVMPSLVYRTARIAQGSRFVAWDGVKRELETVNEPRNVGGFHVVIDPAGEMPAVSLHVLVFDADGERIFESYGGLDLVHKFDFSSAPKVLTKGHLNMPLKSRRLGDEAAISEGIAVTFEPYLTPPPEAGAEGR
jgi:hypothetical protein